ncbi:MAG: transglutaminase-like domain-containing protein [Clostridiales bacterium]|jgi:transglutaminase-like putative cysteine protease|nr:transglutaminase-like domain-containing protein [Clostridiales bacterium]
MEHYVTNVSKNSDEASEEKKIPFFERFLYIFISTVTLAVFIVVCTLMVKDVYAATTDIPDGWVRFSNTSADGVETIKYYYNGVEITEEQYNKKSLNNTQELEEEIDIAENGDLKFQWMVVNPLYLHPDAIEYYDTPSYGLSIAGTLVDGETFYKHILAINEYDLRSRKEMYALYPDSTQTGVLLTSAQPPRFFVCAYEVSEKEYEEITGVTINTKEDLISNRLIIDKTSNDGPSYFYNFVNSFTKRLTAAETSSLAKLEKVYDFIIRSYAYTNKRDGEPIDISMRPTDEDIEKEVSLPSIARFWYNDIDGSSAKIMRFGEGDCYAYSSLFILMAESLGFKPHLINGCSINTSGSMNHHAWVEIEIDGEYYYFDTQIESSQWQRNRNKENYNPRGWWMQPRDSEKTQSRYKRNIIEYPLDALYLDSPDLMFIEQPSDQPTTTEKSTSGVLR